MCSPCLRTYIHYIPDLYMIWVADGIIFSRVPPSTHKSVKEKLPSVIAEQLCAPM